MTKTVMRAPRNDEGKVEFLVTESFPEVLEIEELVDNALDDREDDSLWEERSTNEQIGLLDDPKIGSLLTAPQLARLREALSLRLELESLSSEMLTARFEPRWIVARRGSQDKANTDYEAEWASTRRADFEHWSSVAYWTVPEAICLSFGIEPATADGANLRSWPKRLRRRLDQLTLRLSRAVDAKTIGSDILSPAVVARWFVRMNIDRPLEFDALAEVPTESGGTGEGEPRGKETSSLHRLLFTLAFPKVSSMPDQRAIASAVKKIEDLSALAGHKIDDETARRHLKAAIETAKRFVKFPANS